jgi:hypothetical protein
MMLIIIIGCGEEESYPPVADAGKNIPDAIIGVPIQLDGRESQSNNGAPLTYQWSIVTKPEGSAAMLINNESARPIFTPDKEGDYTFSLVVSDGERVSDPAIMTVKVVDEILPGNRISDFSLGQTFEQIIKKHGQPDKIEGKMFRYQTGIGGTILDENGNGNIDNFEQPLIIAASSPFKGKTPGGNGVDSPLKSFEREFGIVEDVRGSIHYWWRKGIAVSVEQENAEVILVFLPQLPAAPPAQQREVKTIFPDLRDLMKRVDSLIKY